MLALSNYRRKLFDLQTFQNQAHIISVTGIIIYFLGTYYLYTFLSPGDSREGPTCIQNCSTQCIWVVRIHITPLGPLTDLYGTPGPSKRALLAPKGPGGPIGSRRALGDQFWSQLLPIGLTGLESWLPDTMTWYLASSGPPGPPKGPVLAPIHSVSGWYASISHPWAP